MVWNCRRSQGIPICFPIYFISVQSISADGSPGKQAALWQHSAAFADWGRLKVTKVQLVFLGCLSEMMLWTEWNRLKNKLVCPVAPSSVRTLPLPSTPGEPRHWPLNHSELSPCEHFDFSEEIELGYALFWTSNSLPSKAIIWRMWRPKLLTT